MLSNLRPPVVRASGKLALREVFLSEAVHVLSCIPLIGRRRKEHFTRDFWLQTHRLHLSHTFIGNLREQDVKPEGFDK